MVKHSIEIDQELIDNLVRAGAEIAEKGLNALSDDMRQHLARALASGSLYLHLQLHPTPAIVLAFDPQDPNKAPMALGRWEPESVDFDARKHLH